MRRGIDFHAHIIPGADHGCAASDEAARQLIMMNQAGIATVVATPHFYPAQHEVEDFLARVDFGMERLLTKLPPEAPRLYLGAEVLLCPNLHKMPGFEKLCIRGTRVMLLELPFTGCNDALFETVQEILEREYTVVLAHIDRYIKAYGDQIHALLDMGALAQINASSLNGWLARKRMLPYLKDQRVVAFGSDLHREDADAMAAYAALQKLPDDLFSRICERTAELLTEAVEIKSNAKKA